MNSTSIFKFYQYSTRVDFGNLRKNCFHSTLPYPTFSECVPAPPCPPYLPYPSLCHHST